MIYSNTKREIIGILNSWVIWSVLLANGLALAMILFPAFSSGGLGQVFSIFLTLFLVSYFFWLYRLSIAVNPSKFEACSTLLVQFVPLFGLIFTIILLVKAWRISKGGTHAEVATIAIP